MEYIQVCYKVLHRFLDFLFVYVDKSIGQRVSVEKE